MKVKYIGDYYRSAFDKEKVYEVVGVEKGWYRIIDEGGEDYLFHPSWFIVVEE